MDIAMGNGRLIAEPGARPRHSLDELLAQSDATGDDSPEDRDWMNARPAGKELL